MTNPDLKNYLHLCQFLDNFILFLAHISDQFLFILETPGIHKEKKLLLFINFWKTTTFTIIRSYTIRSEYFCPSNSKQVEKLCQENYLHLLLQSCIMKATWIWLLFLVGQSTLSDCMPQYQTYHASAGLYWYRYNGNSGCVGQLSLYQGHSSLGQIE